MPDWINRVGQRLSDYSLLRHLGSGGFGDVYLAEHIRTQERVAIKILHGRLAGSNDFKEFINEARTIRLKHSHIVSLLDFGMTSDDVPYLVMDYAAGGTLRDRHPKGTPVPLATVVSYVTPLAEALTYAHEQYLIHRDVKPENLLVAADSRLLLSDFGIATIAQSSHLMNTQSGIGGTLPYMAPEQLQGKPRPASDQYALAIVTYEWLAGVRPFHGTQAELVIQHTMMPPPPLRELIPTLPVEVERVVLTALAKDPKARFATVNAFAQALSLAAHPVRESVSLSETVLPAIPPLALSSIAGPLPVMTHTDSAPLVTDSAHLVSPLSPPAEASIPVEMTLPAESSPRVPRSPSSLALPRPFPAEASRPRRSRRTMMVLGSLLLALLVMSTGILWMASTINTQRIQATATAQGLRVTAQIITATATSAISAYEQYVATNGIMSGIDAQRTHNNPFEQILSPATISNLHLAWRFSAGDGTTSSPAVANGAVYVGSLDANLYAIDAASGQQKWRFPTGGSIYSSPAVANGVVYVGSIDGNLYAIDAASGQQKWRFPAGGSIYSSPAVANGAVYVGSQDKNLYAFRLPT